MSNGFEIKSDGTLLIRQGATAHLPILYPLNLSGFAARLHIVTRPKALPVILALTTENDGIEITPGEQSEILIKASASQTALIKDFFSGYYNLEIESSSGDVTRVLDGAAELSTDVVKD